MKSSCADSGLVVMILLSFLTPAYGEVARTGGHASKPHVHKKHARLKNPVPLSTESVEAGKQIFERQCIACHGKGAERGGVLDLTDGQWIHGPSDGEIFQVISTGVAGTAMRGCKEDLSEEMRWHMVNYIRSCGVKKVKQLP